MTSWPRDNSALKAGEPASGCILVDILGLPITNSVEVANMAGRRGLLARLAPLWPTIRSVVADACCPSPSRLIVP